MFLTSRSDAFEVGLIRVHGCSNGTTVVSVCDIFCLYMYFSAMLQKSDTFLLVVVNCLAILYLYNQFSNLKKAGSKYLLGKCCVYVCFNWDSMLTSSTKVAGCWVLQVID